jgi:hypothetical protein
MQVALLEAPEGPRFKVHKIPHGGFCAKGGEPVPAELLPAAGTTPAAHFKKEIERCTAENLELFHQLRAAEGIANAAEETVLRCVQREHARAKGGLCRSCTELVTGHLSDVLRALRQHPKSRKALTAT